MINKNKPQAAGSENLLTAVEELENAIISLSYGLAQVRSSVRKLAVAIEEKSSPADHIQIDERSSASGLQAGSGEISPGQAEDVPRQGVQIESDTTNDAGRDEVRRVVGEPRLEIGQAAALPLNVEPEADAVATDPEAARLEVQRAVERVRAEIDDGLLSMESEGGVPQIEPQQVEPEPARAEISRPEESAINGPSLDAEEPQAPDERQNATDFAAGIPGQPSTGGADEQSKLPVDRSLRSNPLAPESPEENGAGSQFDDKDRREEVRRAVEQARSEIHGSEPTDESPAEEPRSILLASMAGAEGRASDDLAVKSPVLIIENSGGRVELVQVFETLNRVQQSAQAALLNYSSNSISVGLSSLSEPLDPDELAKAAGKVFGKECSATTHDNEISILVGLRKAA